MRFDVLIKHRNFDSVAQMLHKKATLENLISRVALLNYIFREVNFPPDHKNKLASVDLTVFVCVSSLNVRQA